MLQKFLTPKFALAVLTGVLVVLNQGLDMNLPTNSILSVAGVVITYMLTETHFDKFLMNLIHKKDLHSAAIDGAKALAEINAGISQAKQATTQTQQVIQDSEQH